MCLDDCFIEFVMVEALIPASRWEKDVVSCFIEYLCSPGMSTNLITMVTVFDCQESHLALGHKPESICSELNHVLLRPQMVFLCVRSCSWTFSSIVGLIRQYLFVVVHVVLLTEAPNRLNVLDIPSVCPGP